MSKYVKMFVLGAALVMLSSTSAMAFGGRKGGGCCAPGCVTCEVPAPVVYAAPVCATCAPACDTCCKQKCRKQRCRRSRCCG